MLSTVVTGQLLVDGVVQGMVYGLLAMSLVLVYRSNQVINFAVGNMGLVGAGLLVICNVNYGIPFWISVAIALVVGTLYGAVVELAVVRRLFRAPRVIVLVATIGVAQLSLAIVTAYPHLFGEGKPFPRAVNAGWKLGSVQLRGPQLLILLAAPAIALALGWFLNRTMLGWAVSAAADNPDLARGSGISPKVASTAVWAISGLLATVSMILIGGADGSASNLQTLGPSALVRALVAALIARFRSFRVALVAAIALGVGESVLRFNFLDVAGLADLVLLLIVLVTVWLQSRGATRQEPTFSFVPAVEAVPQRLESKFWVRNLGRITLAVLALLIALVPLVVTTPSKQQLYAVIGCYAICALSLTVLTGWAGQLSLGQMAFAGIGAFTAAALTRGLAVDLKFSGMRLFAFELYPVPFALAIVLAGVATMLLSVLIGAGALRVRGHLLAVSTFAFALAAQTFLYRLDVFSGHATTSVPFTRGDLLGLDLSDQRTYFYVVLAVLVVLTIVLGRVRRTGVGRVMLAVRDNPDSAASYSIRTAAERIRAFALAGFIAGIGGALLAGASQQISLSQSPFVIGASLSLVAMVVIGGMGSTTGAVIGALWVVGLPAIFPDNDLVPLLSSSLGLLVLLLYFPGGLMQVVYAVRGAIFRALERGLPPVTKSSVAPPPVLARTSGPAPDAFATVLRAERVSVEFGGVRANDEVSIEVRAGEIVGLIGTNGAGKTTLMNAVGGFVRATGTIEVLGHDVTGFGPARRARLGLGRTFQAATLFPELTVRETVEVALEARGRSGLLSTALALPHATRRERSKRNEAAELVDFLGLGRYADRPINVLSTGTRRIVELAGLLALDARVLCLDEPTAGVAQREAEAMAPLLIEIRRQLGASMLVIEHDMPLVMGMSDRIYCLELGRVIAEGAPGDIRDDPAVIASYLGTDGRAIARSGRPAGPTAPHLSSTRGTT